MVFVLWNEEWGMSSEYNNALHIFRKQKKNWRKKTSRQPAIYFTLANWAILTISPNECAILNPDNCVYRETSKLLTNVEKIMIGWAAPVGAAAMFHEIIISIKKIYRLISVKLRLKDSICIINWRSFGIAIASNGSHCSKCHCHCRYNAVWYAYSWFRRCWF